MRDNLSDAAIHKDAVGNKQADVSNEVEGFEHSEGIWVIPSHESLMDRLSSSITHTDQGD